MSAWKRLSAIPTPSIIARRMPPIAAEPTAGHIPCLIARIKPVPAPLIIEFHGSSFCLNATKEQSHKEKVNPHTPKLPAVLGALIRAFAMPPINRFVIPLGAFLAPATMEKSPPPTNPREYAPPQSSSIRHGQGSLV
uniref:Receptor-interacting serine/threonine-protein kinase 1-like n=1 Tax=Phallusia mammillata TaxID=59560 RepID=A0A6F9DR58_9ASCI|nr:receptor-interacting serine/threonine-protein kinase 1-like [Phallusia mammillata]